MDQHGWPLDSWLVACHGHVGCLAQSIDSRVHTEDVFFGWLVRRPGVSDLYHLRWLNAMHDGSTLARMTVSSVQQQGWLRQDAVQQKKVLHALAVQE